MRILAFIGIYLFLGVSSVLAQGTPNYITGFRAQDVRVTDTPGTAMRREPGRAVCDAAQVSNPTVATAPGATIACIIPIVLRTNEGLFLIKARGRDVYIAETSVFHNIPPAAQLPQCPPGVAPGNSGGRNLGSMGAGSGATCRVVR